MKLDIDKTDYVGPELNIGYKTIIDEEHMEMFMLKALENYSNPIQTLVQEYINNAKDSNREAGRPDHLMDVQIPTLENPVFKLRDYGVGLDHEGIINVYRKLGTSTKRKENKKTNQLTGGYGAGSKIWIRYTDAILIKAWKNGREIHYMGHTANTALGEYSCIGDMESDKPDGVEIEIALKHVNDVQSFVKAIRRMFMFWETKPNLSEEIKNWPEILYENDKLILCEDSLVDSLSICVDGTTYPLHYNLEAYSNNRMSGYLSDIGCDVVLKAKITDVDVPMNREQVSDDNDLYEFIKKAKDGIASATEDYANEILDGTEFDTFADLTKTIKDISEIVPITSRKFHIKCLDREIAYEKGNSRFSIQNKVSDTFELFSYNTDHRINYHTTSIYLHENGAMLEENKFSKYYIGRVRRSYKSNSLNFWKHEIPKEYIEFFGLKTYEECVPKATRSYNYDYNKISSSEVHYKYIAGGGDTVSVEDFINTYPADKPLIVEMLVKNKGDYEKMKLAKAVFEYKYGDEYNFICISNRTKKVLLKHGYDNFRTITEEEIKKEINGDFLSKVALRRSVPPEFLKHLALHPLKKFECDKELYNVVKLLKERKETKYFKFDLDDDNQALIRRASKYFNEKYTKISERFPFMELGYSHDKKSKKVISWMFTNLDLLSSAKMV